MPGWLGGGKRRGSPAQANPQLTEQAEAPLFRASMDEPDSQSLPPRRRLSFFRRHPDSRPLAAPPGTLQHVGRQRVEKVTVQVVDYEEDGVREFSSGTVAECVDFEGRDTPTWIRVIGLHDPGVIGPMLEAYGIHPLIQDDILNTNQPPKSEEYGDYIFVTLKQLVQCGAGDQRTWETRHFSMILTNRVVLTFEEEPTPVFDPVLLRLREGKGRLRKRGPDYLAWALLDATLDHYLVACDDLGEEVAAMDERIMLHQNGIDLSEIHALRARTNFLHRSIRPLREVIVGLQHSESDLLSESLTPFLRDLYDHAWHAIEDADHLREAVTAIRDYHTAVMSQRLNEVMRVLTAISTIFLPLTFIAGIYGMNFENMPELKHPLGYPAVWVVFILVTLGMLWFFRRKKWM